MRIIMYFMRKFVYFYAQNGLAPTSSGQGFSFSYQSVSLGPHIKDEREKRVREGFPHD